MAADAENSPDKKRFRFPDFAMTCGFVLLGIFLIYVVMSLLGIGELPTTPRQFIGP